MRLPGASSPAWVLAETGTAALFSLGSLLLIARAIGPEAAGLGALAIAAFLLTDLVTASLFTDTLVRHPGLAARHVGSATTAQVLLGAGAGLLLAGGAPALAAVTGQPDLVPLLQALAVLLPFSAFSGASAGLVLRRQHHRLLALRVLIGQPIALGLGLLLARQGFGAWAMVANQAGATLVAFVLMLLAGELGRRPMLDRAALGALWPVAGPQILALIVSAGRYRLFLLGLGLVVSGGVLASANLAFRMVDTGLAVVLRSLARLSLPRLAPLQQDRAALADTYGDFAELQALLGMPIAAGLALVAPDAVLALLGPAWTEAAGAVRLAGLAALLTVTYGDAGSLFVALGRTRTNLHIALLSLALPLLALLALRPSTPGGAALCWAAGTALPAPLLAALVLRKLGRSPLWLARRLASAATATAAMAAVVLLVRGLVPADPFAALPLTVGAGAAVYGATAWLALGRRMPAALRRPPARRPVAPAKGAALPRLTTG